MSSSQTIPSSGSASADPQKLPPSLAVKPNIAPEHQTLEQLRAERDYWQAQIDSATGWGASVGAAAGFRDGCEAWIKRRLQEPLSKAFDKIEAALNDGETK